MVGYVHVHVSCLLVLLLGDKLQVEGPVPDSMTSVVSSSVKGSLRGATAASAESSSHLGSTVETGSHRGATQPSRAVESRSSQDWKAVKAGTCRFLCAYVQ